MADVNYVGEDEETTRKPWLIVSNIKRNERLLDPWNKICLIYTSQPEIVALFNA